MNYNLPHPSDQNKTKEELIFELEKLRFQSKQFKPKSLSNKNINNRRINKYLGLALLLLLLPTIGFFLQIKQLKEKHKLLEDNDQFLEQIEASLNSIGSSTIYSQSNNFSGDYQKTLTYKTAINSVKDIRDKLEQTREKYPDHQAEINQIKKLLDARILILKQTLNLGKEKSLDRLNKIDLTNFNKNQEQIEAQLKKIEQKEGEIALLRQEETSRNIDCISFLVGISYFLSFVFLIKIYRQFRQELELRQEAEQNLQQTNEQLENRIEERTIQLTQLNKNLEKEIEERRQLENLLRESEERFRQAIYEAPLPIIIHAEDGEILQMNWAWSELSGYKPQEIPNISVWTEKVFPEHHETVRKYIRQLFELNQRVAEGEYTLINHQGKTIIWDCYSAPLKTLSDGRRIRITMGLNITERKEAEKALQSSELRYATLTEFAPVGIFHTDKEGNCTYVNQRWCEIAGLNPSQAKRTGWIKALHPEDLQRVSAAWIRMLAGQTPFHLEYRFQNPQEKITWVVGQAIPETNSGGEILGYIGTITDISKQKQTEFALAQSEERFRQAILNAPVPMIIHADDGAILQISRAWIDITGYTLEDIPTVADWTEKAYGITKEEVRADIERLYSLPGPLAEGEYVITTKTGAKRVWEFYSACLGRLSDGRRTVISTALDVTERKKAELQLKLTKQNLEIRVAERTAELEQELDKKLQTQKILAEQAQLLDLAHDTILTRDLEGTILFWNKGAEKMYGFSRLEAVGQNKNRFLKTQYPEPSNTILAKLFEQDYWEGELTHQKKDGSTIIVASRWVLQRDSAGKPSKVLEINNDITGHKRAKEALQQNEAMFRSLSESSPIGIFLTDARGQILYTNPRYQEIAGATNEEALGEGWKQFIHSEDLNTIVADWIATIGKQEKSFYPEVRYCHKNGKMRYAQVYTSAIFTDEGKLTGFVGTVEDITERRQIEQMKKDFISIVSHELRTPLTSIYGSLGLLAAGVYDNKPEKGKKMIQIAATETDRLVRLVNDILDLGHLESGKLKLKMEVCQATHLMRQALEVMSPKAAQEQITLSMIPLDVQVWADFDSIIQTLTNLLSNAIKFSPPNSNILVQAQLINSDDKIKLWQQKRPSLAALSHPYVLFGVQDQGRGIPPNKLHIIFEKFQQVDATDSRDKGGTGLGLAICRTIIEQHGGQIWVDSILGQGSTFYFTLPLASNSSNL